jgi:hypothetical protein
MEDAVHYNVNRARHALQYVVRSPYHSQLWRKIQAAAKKPKSMPFKDDQEPLNELVSIGRQKYEALDNLYKIVLQKRRGKSDYQREFMAAKRRRDRKFIRQQELVTGSKMNYDARREVLLDQYQAWHAQRDDLLAKNAGLSWEARNELLRKFWAEIEEDLDRAIEDFS